MPTFPPPSSATAPVEIYLHYEDATSCKAWTMAIRPMSFPTTWTLESTWGPAARSGTAGPTMKAKLAQKRTYLGSGASFQDAAEEFVRRVSQQMSDGYKIVSEAMTVEIRDAMHSTLRKARASTGTPLLDKLMELAHPSLQEKFPVLLDGPPGTFKTHTAREFGKACPEFHGILEVAGAPSLEAIDFLGGMIPMGGGKTVWMDGPVTRAFREASKGRKVLLVIDEINRIPRRERGIFLNALSPHDGHYMLRTGRPVNVDDKEGTAMMELLGAPVKNLSIVATTNSGTNYPDVEEEDPAGRERWHILHVKPDETRLKAIIVQTVVARGWPASLADDFLALRKGIQKAREDNFCEKDLSPRLTIRVVSLTKLPTKEGIRSAASEMIPALVGRTPDGDINKEQEEALEKTIRASLKL